MPTSGPLIERTEGWPVGLYLAALAINAGGPREQRGFAFTGDDRLMADYLQAELLSRLSQAQVSFLTRTSVLERMCGPLCDAIAGRRRLGRDAGVPRSGPTCCWSRWTGGGEWYRYHHLLRDLLGAELRRREPDIVPQLHRGAAAVVRGQRPWRCWPIDHARQAG